MEISDNLNFKFELVGVQNEDKIKIYGNAAKYAYCLKLYFKSMGIKVYLGFKSAYKSKYDEVLAPVKSKITLEEIKDTYITLMSKSQYQDALILHFVYSLSLDPYRIFELCLKILYYLCFVVNSTVIHGFFCKLIFLLKSEIFVILLRILNS